MIATEMYVKILKIEPKNIDATCDLSYIYYMKLNKKREAENMLNDCLKNAKDEKDKAKLQLKIKELLGDIEGKYEDGLDDGQDNFLDDDESAN